MLLAKKSGKRHILQAKEWVSGLTLLAKIVMIAVIALVAFVAISIRLCALQGANPDIFQSQSPIATAIAVVGIPAAVGYLVIKYHERLDEEKREEREEREEERRRREEARVGEDRVNASMTAAITMLGDKAPSTRIAGVYALADIADGQGGSYRQRVVDILCGYLRTKREEDGAVESTIIGTIARHVSVDPLTHKERVKPKRSWSGCSFDLHGATLIENINLCSATFSGGVDFHKVTFEGTVFFGGATFEKLADFEEAEFDGETDFSEATFEGPVSFHESTFKDETNFVEATFANESYLSGATFVKATFEGAAHFGEATFEGGANFPYATFKKKVEFDETVFRRKPNFIGATFNRSISGQYLFGHIKLVGTTGLPEAACWDSDKASWKNG